MQGRDYIRHPEANYRHMVRMLEAIWDATNAMPSQRFVPDERFKYDVNAIKNYLITEFADYDIDAAHRSVRQTYGNKGRGRPKGALGKRKLLGQENQDTTPQMDKPHFDAFDIEINPEDFGDDVNKPDQAADTPKLDSQQQIDMQKILRDYVTKRDLEAKQYIDQPALFKVVHNVGDALRNYVDEEVKKVKPNIIELKRTNAPNVQLGIQHKNLPELLSMCIAATLDNSHLNVWLYGPAATGKSTAGKMVAKALTAHFERDFPFYMLPALETGFQVLGYSDGNGNYVSTLFRKAWEFGGVMMLDECDSYMPSAAIALNGALANGVCSFPDRMVPRHPDCIIIAGANTTGLGGTMEYSGRMKQDAAFLDRFITLDWPIDDALEANLCPNQNWLLIVRHCRERVIAQQIKGVMVTMRASIYGEALLRAGLSVERTMKATIQKAMSEAQWNMIKPPQHLIEACKPAANPA